MSPLTIAAPAWVEDAACRDHTHPDAWFLDNGSPPQWVLDICAGCPTRLACLDFAMRTETDSTRFGIYGGLTANQRRALARGEAS